MFLVKSDLCSYSLLLQPRGFSLPFVSCAMADFQHVLTCSALDVAGRPMPAGRGYGPHVGSLLLCSTPTERLCDYEVWHSYADLSFGALHGHWFRIGSVGDVFAYGGEDSNSMTQQRLLDDDYTSMYVFASRRGGCDVYTRHATVHPRSTFSRYYLAAVDDPTLWWRARTWRYEGRVEEPGLVRGLLFMFT